MNAIIHDYPVLLHHVAKDRDCKVQIAGEPLQDGGYGIAMAKGSPLKLPISFLIRTYIADGFFGELREKWLSSQCEHIKKSDSGEAERFGVTYMGGAFLMIIVGAVICIIIWYAEKIVFKAYAKKSYAVC